MAAMLRRCPRRIASPVKRHDRRLRSRRLAHFRFFFFPFFAAFLAAFPGTRSAVRALTTIFEGLGLVGASGATTSGAGSFFFGTDYLFLVGGGPVRVAGLLGFGRAGGAGTTAGLEGVAGLVSLIGGSHPAAAAIGAMAATDRLAPLTSTGRAFPAEEGQGGAAAPAEEEVAVGLASCLPERDRYEPRHCLTNESEGGDREETIAHVEELLVGLPVDLEIPR
jgi:hypothetical protein